MKSNNIRRAGSTVLAMVALTLGAKLLGMLRQMMTTAIFAASTEGVAFSAASRLPLAIFDMLFSTAILGTFLPIYRGHLLSGEKRARAFSSSFFTLILCVTSAAALAGVLLARPVLKLAAPNLEHDAMELAVLLLRIMFPSMIFAGAAYTLIGILQSHERFLLPAAVSAVSNLMLIGYLALLSPDADMKRAVIGLAAVYMLSWLAQFLTLAVPLMRSRRMPTLLGTLRDSELALAGKRSLPVMLGAWLIPSVTLMANAFSTYIDGNAAIGADASAGAAIVVFENAFSLFSIAGGLMTYGICNYLFPKLAARFSAGDGGGFARSVQTGLILSLTVSLPIAAALAVLSDEAVRLLYERGDFTRPLADATAQSLRALCIALPSYGIIELMSRACYSCAKVKRPMTAALVGIAAGLITSVLLNLTDTLSILTVALSASLAMTAAALTHLVLSREMLGNPIRAVGILMLGTAGAAALMEGCRSMIKKILKNDGSFQNFVTIAIVFIIGFVVYLIWIFLFRKILFTKNLSERRNFSDG